jgi:hypothetical protein
MTWTAAADAVMSACAHARHTCPPTAVPRQRGLGCASPLRRPRLLRADLTPPGRPSDPRRGCPSASSIVLRDEDSGRDLRSPRPLPWPPTFAVGRPGSPATSPRDHGMPGRGFAPCHAYRLALAGDPTVPCCTDISEEVKRRLLADLNAGFSAPLPG